MAAVGCVMETVWSDIKSMKINYYTFMDKW